MSYAQFMEKFMEALRETLPPTCRFTLSPASDPPSSSDPLLSCSFPPGDQTLHYHPSSLYQQYLQGIPLALLISRIQDELLSPSLNLPFQEVASRIIFKLVSTKQETTWLEQIPHHPLCDLAITYCLHLEQTSTCLSTAQITYAHCRRWEILPHQLHVLALKNTPHLLPPKLALLGQIVQQLMQGMPFESTSAQTSLLSEEGPYVLTNTAHTLGAAAVLYPGVLEKFGEQVQADFYVLPSSIHEVVLLPCVLGMDVQNLQRIVQEINESQVLPKDRLSNRIYVFRRQEKQLFLC